VKEVWLNSLLTIWRDKSAGFLNSVFSTDMAEPFSFVSKKNPDLTKKFQKFTASSDQQEIVRYVNSSMDPDPRISTGKA
jgi:hypothetical protein